MLISISSIIGASCVSWLIAYAIHRDYKRTTLQKFKESLDGRYIKIKEGQYKDQIIEVDDAVTYDSNNLSNYLVRIYYGRSNIVVPLHYIELLPVEYDPENPLIATPIQAKSKKKGGGFMKRMPLTVKWAINLAIAFLIWNIAYAIVTHINEIAIFVTQFFPAHPCK